MIAFYRFYTGTNEPGLPPRPFARAVEAADYARRHGQYAGKMTEQDTMAHLRSTGGYWYRFYSKAAAVNWATHPDRRANTKFRELLASHGAPDIYERVETPAKAAALAAKREMQVEQLDLFAAAAAHMRYCPAFVTP